MVPDLNLSHIVNITTTTLLNIANLQNIPSLFALVLVALSLAIIVKLGIIAIDSIVQFLSKFIVPIVLFGTAYLMALLYYIPTYAPSVFVDIHNATTNETVYIPNQTVIKDLKQKANLLLIPSFYDRLLYYQTIYERPIDEVLVTFMILFIIFIYLTHFVFWKYLNIYSIILTSMLFFILTLGYKGTILALLSYDIIKLIIISYIAVYVGIILLKLKVPSD